MIGLLPYLDHALKFADQVSPDKGMGKMDSSRLIFWMAMGLGIVSYVMVLTGLTVYLIDQYDASIALCVVGLVTLSTMLLLVAGHRTYLRIRRQKMQQAVKDITDDISVISKEILEKIDDGVKDNAVLLAAVSAFAGYMVSRKMF